MNDEFEKQTEDLQKKSSDLEKRLEEAAKRIAKIGEEIKEQVEQAKEQRKSVNVDAPTEEAAAGEKNAVDEGLNRLRETVDSVGKQLRGLAEEAGKNLDSSTKVAFGNLQDALKQVQDRIETARKEGTFDDFVSHQRRGLEEAIKALEESIPEGVRTHGKNALGEFVEGYKKLFAGLFPQAPVDEKQRVEITVDDEETAETPTEPDNTGSDKT